MIFLDPELSVFPAVIIISLLFFHVVFQAQLFSKHTNYRTLVCRIIYLHSI